MSLPARSLALSGSSRRGRCPLKGCKQDRPLLLTAVENQLVARRGLGERLPHRRRKPQYPVHGVMMREANDVKFRPRWLRVQEANNDPITFGEWRLGSHL